MSSLMPWRRRESGTPQWDPFRELEEMHERMGRLVESSFGAPGRSMVGWSPPVDVEETDDAWVLEAELPGVNRDDVSVELHDGELAITGELKERERKGVLRRQVRRSGRFDYRLTLPGEVQADKIEASLDKGVLTLRVPKTPRAQPRRIEVKAGG
jgi:HSP20 family protein